MTTLAVLALAAATLVAREVARAYGRSVRARFAAERADEQETQRWLAIVRGPRRDGEVYA